MFGGGRRTWVAGSSLFFFGFLQGGAGEDVRILSL